MVFTDFGFSVVRNWLVGGASTTAPSGLLVGTGSKAESFADLLLGSPLDPTRRAFASKSGLGYTVEFEGLVDSGDITTGSIVREIGMIAASGGNLFFRSLTSEIELNGSVVITPIVTLYFR